MLTFIIVLFLVLSVSFLFEIFTLSFSETVDLIKLFCCFYFKCRNFFFGWFAIDSDFIVYKFDSLVYFSDNVWWKQVQILESINSVNIMSEFIVLSFNIFFLFFFDFFNRLFISFIFFGCDNFSPFFNLFFPFLTDFNLAFNISILTFLIFSFRS
jgi:hypothetical protein